MRLLLVEDDSTSVDLLVASLRADGHEIVVERDGESGRQRAVAERFDLVVLDAQLPQLDGLALCRYLRAVGITAPIVALSSAAMSEQVHRGKEMEFDAYLSKPIAPEALRQVVRRFDTRLTILSRSGGEVPDSRRRSITPPRPPGCTRETRPRRWRKPPAAK